MSRVYRSGEKGGLHRVDLTQTATSQEFDAQRELCAHVMVSAASDLEVRLPVNLVPFARYAGPLR